MIAPARTLGRALLLHAAIVTLAVAAAISAGTIAVPSALADSAAPAAAPKQALTVEKVELPTLAVPEEAPVVAAPAPVVPAGPDWSISIGAIGLQAEVDQCIWVRMDFSAAVTIPIVGAHNFCGGGIVLEMTPGQTVSLSGAGLDGSYVVADGRDAWADADAADAIAGMSGDVILQTCYWDDNGTLRLVALHRVG